MEIKENLSNEDLRNLMISIYKECYKRTNKEVEIIEALDIHFSPSGYQQEIRTWIFDNIPNIKTIAFSAIKYVQPLSLLFGKLTTSSSGSASYNTIIIDKIGNTYTVLVEKYSEEVLVAKDRIAHLEKEIEQIKAMHNL